MIRKLRLESLSAELSSINALLENAEEIGDPVGAYQYAERKRNVESEINKLSGAPDTLASVALYFSGGPVIGSRGILADFATNVLEEFQNLISKVQALSFLGSMGERGRVPSVGNADLMITQITKGSFGFVLEELADEPPLFNTSLSESVDFVSHIIADTCAEDIERFDNILAQIDSRVLISLKKFLRDIDTNHAELKIVESDQEFSIDHVSAARGRQRVETTDIEEKDAVFEGMFVGFLPEHRKFEFKARDIEEVLYGSASPDAIDQYNDLTLRGETIINEDWIVTIEVRTVKPLNSDPKYAYRLKKIVKRIE